MIFQYFLPTKIVFGSGSIDSLTDYLKSEFPKIRSIFLITGKRFLRESGSQEKILKMLHQYTVYLFDGVESGPTSQTLAAALKHYKDARADVILAIGGGSVMDLGKAVAILATNKGTLAEYQTGKKPINDPVPYVAVPTTIGTASEMTIWSVITNHEGLYLGKRKSFSHEKMYPTLAIIDPDLTLTLEPKNFFGTALDIFSASIESFWSKRKNPISSAFALEAIKLALETMPKLWRNPQDKTVREQIGLACLFSGFAVSNSRTGMPHKISYPLSTYYKVPHGTACAITIPYFLEFFGTKDIHTIAPIMAILKGKNPMETRKKFVTFFQEINMPSKLSELGIQEERIPFIVEESYVPIDEQTDPVPLSKEQVQKILEQAL